MNIFAETGEKGKKSLHFITANTMVLALVFFMMLAAVSGAPIFTFFFRICRIELVKFPIISVYYYKMAVSARGLSAVNSENKKYKNCKHIKKSIFLHFYNLPHIPFLET